MYIRPTVSRHLPHLQLDAAPLFVTFTTRRPKVLPPPARTITLEHCLREHGLRLEMHVAVVMPDHVHLLFAPTGASLSKLVQRMKGASAAAINRFVGWRGSLWLDESYDHLVRRREGVDSIAEYIALNPVRRGLVSSPDDYPWLWRAWIEGAGERRVAVSTG